MKTDGLTNVAQFDHSNSLRGQAKVLPLNELPAWVRDAIIEAAEEMDIDAVDLATILTVHHRKANLNHTETHTPNPERPSEAIHRSRARGTYRKGSERGGQ